MQPTQTVLDDLQDGEVAYQNYSVTMRWVQDIDPSLNLTMGEWWTKDLPEGRCRNSTHWTRMPKEVNVEVLHQEVHDWWPGYSKNLEQFKPTDLTIEVEERRFEVWCLSWFAHWTWDIGLDDQQVLASFHRYISRTKRLNAEESVWKDGILREAHNLMGAEDRWRWHGFRDGKGGNEDERLEPPCRCPGCKKRGIVQIGH